ncbi:hypothetical protein ACS0TY_024869 [Phlomoides rotata]
MVIEEIMHQSVVILALLLDLLLSNRRSRHNRGQVRRFFLIYIIHDQVSNMSTLVKLSDEAYRDQLRMDRVSFARLCELLGTLGGLSNSRYVSVGKDCYVSFILAHHTKNRVIKHHFFIEHIGLTQHLKPSVGSGTSSLTAAVLAREERGIELRKALIPY